MGDLATTLSEEGHLAEAERMQREVLEKQKRLLGPEAHYTLASMDNLASILVDEGRLAEAEKLEEQTLEIQRRVFGEDLTTIHYMMNEANIKSAMGANDQAEKLFRHVLQRELDLLPPDQPEIAITRYNLACLAARTGQTEEAISLLQQAIDHLLPQVASGLEKDPDLKALHRDPRFASLVARSKERAAKESN